MREVGFSTGALAKGDFRSALWMLQGKQTKVVELSALRESELPELVAGLKDLDLKAFSYISVHAPSSIKSGTETEIVNQLKALLDTKWPIVVHPDAISDFSLWKVFGDQLCIENNDLRKPFGQTVTQLKEVFSTFPHATFCCDLGHARQVDPTMSEAGALLQAFGNRLRQLHISEVNTKSTHERISAASAKAFTKICHLIPDTVPVILETPVTAAEIESEIEQVRNALPSQKINMRQMVEGSLDILWANYQEHAATPEYVVHFLRYRGFKDGPKRSQVVSGKSALATYLKDLNVSDTQIKLILDAIDIRKSFDVPNIFVPKSHTLADMR